MAPNCVMDRASPKSAILQMHFESIRTLDGCKHTSHIRIQDTKSIRFNAIMRAGLSKQQ
jgi:hypothetical protein